jgi:hypothetical protein
VPPSSEYWNQLVEFELELYEESTAQEIWKCYGEDFNFLTGDEECTVI